MELIDTHCHLDYECFDNDREQVVEHAHAVGMKYWINPSTSSGTAAQIRYSLSAAF